MLIEYMKGLNYYLQSVSTFWEFETFEECPNCGSDDILLYEKGSYNDSYGDIYICNDCKEQDSYMYMTTHDEKINKDDIFERKFDNLTFKFYK